MGLFGKSKKEIERVSNVIRERIMELDAIIKERDVNGLRELLKKEGIQYQDDDRWVNWMYPDLPDFMFHYRKKEFLVDGRMAYAGFQIFGGNTLRYSVQAPSKKSAAGPAAKQSAKALKEALSLRPEFYDLDKAKQEFDRSLKDH